MDKAAIRQREGITKPQVVAGREFKGISFISKPETILFKVSISKISANKRNLGFHSWNGAYTDHFDDKRFFEF